MTVQVKVLTSSNWDSAVLGEDRPVLVDFWAPWCPPCRALAPAIERLATALAGRAVVGKLDIDQNPDLAGRYGVQSIPTLIVFRNGEPVHRRVGLVSEPDLEEAIESRLAAPGGPASA